MAVLSVVGLQGLTDLMVAADFPHVPPDKTLQPRGHGGCPAGAEETADVLEAVGPDREIDLAMYVGVQVNQSLRKRFKSAIVRPMPLPQRRYRLSLVSTVVEDGSAWILTDHPQERLPYVHLIRGGVGPEGMMLQCARPENGHPDQIVTPLFRDALDIQEQLNGGTRDSGQFVQVDLARPDREGLQLHLERRAGRAIPLPPPGLVQVRKLRDGEDAFLVEAPDHLRRHPGEQGQAVGLLSDGQTFLAERADWAVIVQVHFGGLCRGVLRPGSQPRQHPAQGGVARLQLHPPRAPVSENDPPARRPPAVELAKDVADIGQADPLVLRDAAGAHDQGRLVVLPAPPGEDVTIRLEVPLAKDPPRGNLDRFDDRTEEPLPVGTRPLLQDPHVLVWFAGSAPAEEEVRLPRALRVSHYEFRRQWG